MIARSAYAQLRFSPLLLAGTLLGLALVFGAGPAGLALGHGWARGLAALSCMLMVGSMLPILAFYRRSPLWALALPVMAGFYAGCTLLSAWNHAAGRGGHVEGARPSAARQSSMNAAAGLSAAALASGKGHGDENFPVASWLVAPRFRAPIKAFYHFARAADDIADNPEADAATKLALLGQMRAGLSGAGAAEAMALAAIARACGLSLAHADELLDAFVHDCTVGRTADWDALIAYCAKSAMPVGRFVLDVHGEDRALWPLSDALCAALQIINHLQDCGKDYRTIDRVYLPDDMLAAAAVPLAALAADRASPALLRVIRDCATRARALLAQAAPFAAGIRDARLAAEVAVIQHLALDLAGMLLTRDPLHENVHHPRRRAGLLAGRALIRHCTQRMTRR